MKISNPKFNFLLIFLIPSFLVIGFSSRATDPYESDIQRILESYARDYEVDATFKEDVTFGVKVGEQFWQVVAVAATKDSKASVTVIKGKPEKPTFYFFTDYATLKKIDQGEMNALTASAKAFETDFAPFDADVMEGFQPDSGFMSSLLSVYFHFWTKGTPEVIPFGIDYTRQTHGGQAAVFYYQPGFRSAYVALKRGQHANENEKSKKNPFPSMLVIIRGEGQAIINGVTRTIRSGECVVIPAGVSHEFLNPDHDEPLEAILLMFGKGA